MYATVLEALDLRPGQAFLNIGSGSGYLTCLAANIVGPTGVSHGVEISAAAVDHCKRCVDTWINKLSESDPEKGDAFRRAEPFAFVNCNCFELDMSDLVNVCKYDRIYVGAGCPEQRKEFFYPLLKDGGSIMVVPINERNEMLKIRRLCGNVFSISHVSNVHFAPLIESTVNPPTPTIVNSATNAALAAVENDDDDDDILNVETIDGLVRSINRAEPSTITVLQNLSSVAATSIRPDSAVHHTGQQQTNGFKLPSLLWAPIKTRHAQFPPEFRNTLKLILLTASRNHCYLNNGKGSNGLAFTSPSSYQMRASVLTLLPLPVWYHVFSYMNRFLTRIKDLICIIFARLKSF